MGSAGWAKKKLLLRKKTRRGWGGKKNQKNTNFSILAANANGLKGKFDSLKNTMKHFKPSCVLIQESKLRKNGSLKLKGFQIFELNRQGMGGGLLTAVDENLCPVLISAGNEDSELLVVQAQTGKFKIRIFNGYGPQEGSSKNDILNFWLEVEKQVISAKENGCGIVMELDANAKLGHDIIKHDPNVMSLNGQIMFEMIKRQNLIIGNALSKCNGIITRHRSTLGKDEKSVLDYVLFCEKMEPYFETMLIDESRCHVLKRYVTTKGFKKHIESDHNTLFAKFSLKIEVKRAEVKKEFFNFQNTECLKKFTEITSRTNKFSRCYDSSKPMDENANKFFKTLDDTLHTCFQKIRIKSNSKKHLPCEIQNELDMVTNLKLEIEMSKCKLGKQVCISELEKCEERVTHLMAERNIKLINQQIDQLSSLDGNFNQVGLWKVKKMMLPFPLDPPMAKNDAGGNLITTPLALKSLYLETYKQRLQHRPIKSEHSDIFHLKTQLWELRYKQIVKVKSPPWQLSNLQKSLKGLKSTQSRDPMGLANQPFKPGILGQDSATGLT